jgi:acyl-CoA thioesterase-1
MVPRFLPALLLLWCGCSRDPAPPGPSSERERAPAPATMDSRPVIAAFGDSLTAGFGVDPGQSYPDILQAELDRRGYRYRVVNLGSSGDTTTDGLARVSMVTDLKPEIVILEFGANDGLRGLPIATTRANLDRLIATLKSAGARVVLAGMTLPPNYGPEYIKPFEAIFPDLARKHSATLIPFFLDGVAGTGTYMQRDGLHPNLEGNRRVAALVMRTIEPVLRK